MDHATPVTGGCYCGQVRYALTQPPVLKAQCHCRPCQYFAGGGPNYFMLVPQDGFAYVKGRPLQFSHPEVERPVTRDFCGTCGTHLVTVLPERPQVVVKVGTLDRPEQFGGPRLAIHCLDKQNFHFVPEGVEAFDRLPNRS